MIYTRKLESISDDELLRRLSKLAQQSRRLESELLAHIGEVDQRRLYATRACPSMFAYCTEVLHLSEAEAYLRIAAARTSRKHPAILEMLADGRLHLSGIAKLAPHLTDDNCEGVLARATHKSKREIEELVAELSPKPDVPPVVRKLPTPAATNPPEARVAELRPDAVKNEMPREPVHEPSRAVPSARPAVVEPLAPARYKVSFTASAELRDKLQRLQALMRKQVPDGDLAAIVEAAVTEKLERLEAKRFAETKSPRKSLEETDTTPSSRHIPAPVRRAVRKRDGNRCTFVDERGRRCTERGRLELHHERPYARGGDHSPENVRLMCGTHNTLQAERDYGKEVMERYRRNADRVCERMLVYGMREFDIRGVFSESSDEHRWPNSIRTEFVLKRAAPNLGCRRSAEDRPQRFRAAGTKLVPHLTLYP